VNKLFEKLCASIPHPAKDIFVGIVEEFDFVEVLFAVKIVQSPVPAKDVKGIVCDICPVYGSQRYDEVGIIIHREHQATAETNNFPLVKSGAKRRYNLACTLFRNEVSNAT
jgi:hypothetical protein